MLVVHAADALARDGSDALVIQADALDAAGMRLFGAKKDPSQPRNKHFLYLNLLVMVANTSPTLVLENIVNKRADGWALMVSDEDRAPKRVGKEAVNAVAESQKETRRCHMRKQIGHLKNYPERSTGNSKGKLEKVALAAGNDFKSVDAKSL
ncbi:hypothetical protein PInf_016409 [Phytophthora infestans]|nr:hypothetical protein PInf_016409 [Phytophthora infestans]